MTVTRLNPPVPQVQRGFVEASGVGTAEVTKHVAFSPAFASAPTVVAVMTGASYNRRMHTLNITASGFDMVFATNTTASAWCGAYWVAVL